MALPESIEAALAQAHPSWHAPLRAGLVAMSLAQPHYLESLAKSEFLPTEQRLLAAFTLPIDSVRYVLFGEGPYPRAQSATGVCFMDGAVKQLWQPGIGLTKTVNRATSLRNFIKMLLVADGVLMPANTTAQAMQAVADCATSADSGWIQTGAELQHNLLQNGFLLLNASLVFRPEVAPAVDAKAWLPFLCTVLQALHRARPTGVQLVLWGKIAEKIQQLPQAQLFTSISSEHPYNLSFITHAGMQALFKPLKLLHR